MSEVYSEISPEPVAAASLGQVRPPAALAGCAACAACAGPHLSSGVAARRAAALKAPDPPSGAPPRAQVYKARLRSTGEEVAVKVQRPGVVEAIALDTYILRYVAGALPEGSARTRRAGLAT